MHLQIPSFITLTSLLLTARCSELPVHGATTLTAGFSSSPMGTAKQSSENFLAARTYDFFKGQEGSGGATAVLEGVGQVWQKQQQKQVQMANEAFAEEMRAGTAWLRASNAAFYGPKQHRTGPPTEQQRRRERERETRVELEAQQRRVQDLERTAAGTGAEIRNLGLVNKEMQNRMLRHFPPAPSSDPKLRQKARKAKAARKGEEKQRDKEEKVRSRREKKERVKAEKEERKAGRQKGGAGGGRGRGRGKKAVAAKETALELQGAGVSKPARGRGR